MMNSVDDTDIQCSDFLPATFCARATSTNSKVKMPIQTQAVYKHLLLNVDWFSIPLKWTIPLLFQGLLRRHVGWDSQQVNAQHPFNINHLNNIRLRRSFAYMPFTIRHKLIFCQLDLDILMAWICTRFPKQPKISHRIYYMSEEAKPPWSNCPCFLHLTKETNSTIDPTQRTFSDGRCTFCCVIAHPHLLVLVTNERFLWTISTRRDGHHF